MRDGFLDPYAGAFKKSAETDLRKIPKEIIPHIFEHVENLADDPAPHDAYQRATAENLYRIRVGDYRVIYQRLD